uniref:Uncharacterized protein n=1 Tax=Boodleopsis pusilla TaxID=381415 RepID=A0A386AZC4_9CHLO|nr:hypothetical protein [Boodleopsis pusilla]AYC64800.1 hypothetical protein [Boodleopsis pusilla]
MKNNLNCPVRGKLNIKETDNLDEFTEEYRRIECVRFLLDKGYPKENIDFEREIIKYGHSGRNSLRADIVVYNVSKSNINQNKINNIILVAEIKKKSKNKENAINYQLKPAFNQLKNCLYGIYWDDENRIFFTKENEYENNILKLPFYGEKFESKLLCFNDLKEISNSQKLLEFIEQKIHNLGATNKDFRYKEIFKIFLSKFYDETKNKNKKYLDFQLLNLEKDSELKKRITSLYNEAFIYYSSNTPIKLETSFNLPANILKECVFLLQDYSLIKTNQLVLQEFFMYFAPILLRKELDQYYTPQQVVDFMVENIEISPTSTFIDPCGGSGDFLTGVIHKAFIKNIENINGNIHYWDISQDASNIASLNMILSGDGRSHIEVIDSLEEYQFKNNHFSVCITNPPFGTNTKWEKSIKTMEKYDLGKRQGKPFKQELGILFIERCINLLNKDGILSIILPNGYLTNPSLKYIREFLIAHGRIVGIISLPEGVFKKSNAGGFTTILFFKKEKMQGDYNIFIDVVNKIGFNPTRKNAPKIFKRDDNGDFVLDENNNKIIDNDLIVIQDKLKKFCFNNNIFGMERKNLSINYCFTNLNTFIKDNNLIFCPKRYNSTYKSLISTIKNNNYATLENIKGLVENETSFEKELSKKYIYLETKNLFNGIYKKDNILRGWELPNRAKIGLQKYDILISKIWGCFSKFCIILEDNKNLVATNGFYRIRIKNEVDRLNFYSFLFTDTYKKQMECLSTGTILSDVKKDDILNKLYFNIHKKQENYTKMKNLLTCLESLNNL